MLEGAWYYAASPAASLAAALFVLGLLIRLDYHREAEGTLARRRLGSVIVLSASTYSFGLMFLSQIVLHGPNVSSLVENGFGDSRIAWLMFGVMLDGVWRVWDEFRHT